MARDRVAPSHDELRALVAGAAGALRVFPLPGVVVLPGTPTPLHVFEPRYRAMTRDALRGDRVMAVGLLRRAGDAPLARAPLEPVAGAAYVERDEALPGGRFDILLRGVARVRLAEEIERGLPYREFRATVLEDVYPPEGPRGLEARVEALGRCVFELAQLLPAGSGASELAEAAARMRAPGRLADMVAAALVTDAWARYRVLAETDVAARLDLVTREVAGVLLLLGRGKKGPRA